MENNLMKTIIADTLLITIGLTFDLLLFTLIGFVCSLVARFVYFLWLASIYSNKIKH